MKKHRTKLIGAAAVLCLLVFAWFFGGDYANRDASVQAPSASARDAVASVDAPEGETSAAAVDVAAATPKLPASAGEGAKPQIATPSPAEGPVAPPPEDAAESPAAQFPAEAGTDPAPATQTEPAAGQDPYLTDPTPDGAPRPVEPQDARIGEKAYTVTLSVRCDTILNNLSHLDPAKHGLVPEDGVIFQETTVTFYEGESAFNVLAREMKRAKIHMEFAHTPIYNSAYIEGINNLYEFDVGELSGWEYKVNDWFPNYGCSRYQLKDGDVIEWVYTCDLGRDIGGYNLLGEG